jgi:hypothetical protein
VYLFIFKLELKNEDGWESVLFTNNIKVKLKDREECINLGPGTIDKPD